MRARGTCVTCTGGCAALILAAQNWGVSKFSVAADAKSHEHPTCPACLPLTGSTVINRAFQYSHAAHSLPQHQNLSPLCPPVTFCSMSLLLGLLSVHHAARPCMLSSKSVCFQHCCGAGFEWH